MSEKRNSLFYTSGEGGEMSAIICARDGKSGRDDMLQKGRCHIMPYNLWTSTVSENEGLWAHVMTQSPQGPFGPTVHHNMLDGCRVSCTMSPDGTPYIHTVHPADTNSPEGQKGQNVYTGASVEKGK